ncbi:unnamed protein product [Schistosoma margrebowiei]|uniref:Uncharacterized protein n=1 Tax=Schistosoma margrebowiei TaxID=48269 RepID=A0A183MA41_9TREM|nr:unnamed protein product [Schistosoma margrebowiei]
MDHHNQQDESPCQYLMKSCDDVNEKEHNSNNKLVTDITITTGSNNNNSQSISNASSLELLPKFTDLEQSIPFDTDDDDDNNNNTKANNNNNNKSNKMIATRSVESSNCSPSSTCVTNQISNKTSTSNMQSVKYYHPHQLSNTKLKNSKFTNHFTTTTNNNVYGLEKTVVSPISNQFSSNKSTSIMNNQNDNGNKKNNPNIRNKIQVIL